MDWLDTLSQMDWLELENCNTCHWLTNCHLHNFAHLCMSGFKLINVRNVELYI